MAHVCHHCARHISFFTFHYRALLFKRLLGAYAQSLHTCRRRLGQFISLKFRKFLYPRGVFTLYLSSNSRCLREICLFLTLFLLCLTFYFFCGLFIFVSLHYFCLYFQCLLSQGCVDFTWSAFFCVRCHVFVRTHRFLLLDTHATTNHFYFIYIYTCIYLFLLFFSHFSFRMFFFIVVAPYNRWKFSYCYFIHSSFVHFCCSFVNYCIIFSFITRWISFAGSPLATFDTYTLACNHVFCFTFLLYSYI